MVTTTERVAEGTYPADLDPYDLPTSGICPVCFSQNRHTRHEYKRLATHLNHAHGVVSLRCVSYRDPEYHKHYYQAHKAEMRENYKRWKNKNKAKIQASNHAYYLKKKLERQGGGQ